MNKSVLFCTGIFPPEIGGPATYVLKMAKQMKSRGIKNAIITYSNKADIENYGLNVTRIKWGFFIFTYLKYFLHVLRIGRRYDIIYLQGSFIEGIPTALANFFLQKKLIVRIGGIFAWEYSMNKKLTFALPEEFYSKKQNIKCEILKSLDRLVISQCQKILVNSNYMKKLLILNRIDANKISVIYNSIETTDYPHIPRKILLQRFNLPDKKIILSHGRLVSWKNFDKIINFAKKISNDYLFVIAGEGPKKNELLTLIKENKLHNKVIIIEKQSRENIHYLNELCNIFVLLSSYEGLSNALVETMQQGCSIIASNIEPNIEVLRNYKNCKVVNIDEEEFKKAVYFFENIDLKSDAELDNFNFDDIYTKTINTLCA